MRASSQSVWDGGKMAHLIVTFSFQELTIRESISPSAIWVGNIDDQLKIVDNSIWGVWNIMLEWQHIHKMA